MNDRITRRELLRRGAVGGAALTFPSILAACGGGDGGIEGQGATATGETAATVETTLANRITISNWPLYIDINEETKKRPTIEQFQQETGVNVRYIEDVNDNEEWFGKFQAQLSRGQAIGRDLTVLTDWMAARMVRLGYVEPVYREAMPNADNLVDALASPGWDQNREYSLPWQSGLTGIAYNPKLTGGGRDVDRAAAHGPQAEGQGDGALGDAGHDGPDHARPRWGSLGGGRRRVRRGDLDAPGRGRLGPDPPLHGERLRAASREGRHRRLHRVVGRRRSAPARQPEPPVSASRTRAG
jgi:hypothetical protein